MPATILHGKHLSLRGVHLPDGREGQELTPDGVDWVDASYSTVARLIEFCASLGLSEDDWPVFYGVDPGRADVDEISRRCERLRPLILGLHADECASAPAVMAAGRSAR